MVRCIAKVMGPAPDPFPDPITEPQHPAPAPLTQDQPFTPSSRPVQPGMRTIFPMNSTVPVSRSRSTRMYGWSTRITGITGADVTPIPTVVTAAASDPSSLMSTYVSCYTKSM